MGERLLGTRNGNNANEKSVGQGLIGRRLNEENKLGLVAKCAVLKMSL
jgi:hypothetical protein